jgi:hypothetical protein
VQFAEAATVAAGIGEGSVPPLYVVGSDRGGLPPSAELREGKSDADAAEAMLSVRTYALCSRKGHHP